MVNVAAAVLEMGPPAEFVAVTEQEYWVLGVRPVRFTDAGVAVVPAPTFTMEATNGPPVHVAVALVLAPPGVTFADSVALVEPTAEELVSPTVGGDAGVPWNSYAPASQF